MDDAAPSSPPGTQRHGGLLVAGRAPPMPGEALTREVAARVR
jgi:hypothetical protein